MHGYKFAEEHQNEDETAAEGTANRARGHSLPQMVGIFLSSHPQEEWQRDFSRNEQQQAF
jgi:hypothetical protein